jgi:kynurenine formamidase
VFEKGKLISDIPLEQCFARGVLIDARGKKTIGVDLIPEHVEAKHAVLLCTGMSARYRNDPTYWTTYPALTPEFADELARRRIKMLGMDMAGPEPPPFVSYETHRRLMAHGMLILENLTNLEQLAGVPAFDVIALPVRFAADAAFARVVAIVR